jgi:hypothetical protein
MAFERDRAESRERTMRKVEHHWATSTATPPSVLATYVPPAASLLAACLTKAVLQPQAVLSIKHLTLVKYYRRPAMLAIRLESQSDALRQVHSR